MRRRSPKDQEGFWEITKARSRIFRSYGDQPVSLGPKYEVFDQATALAFVDVYRANNLFVVEIVFGLMPREPKQKASFGGIH
jgi:hypothetical protein